MHCKPAKVKATQSMASLGGGSSSVDDDGEGSRSGVSASLGHSPRSYVSNNNNNNNTNNNNNNDSTSNNTNPDDSQIQLKKQTLEQRKQELEKLLSEKSWLLQQIQKQETQILNGNYEYLNLNEIFGTLQQYNKQDAGGCGGGGGGAGGGAGGDGCGGSAILRRKASSKENHNNSNNIGNNVINNNNNNSNRQSEISNRSSEYDNYPVEQQVASQQFPAGILKVASKKRQTPLPGANTNWSSTNAFPQVQQHHHQQQQQQQQQQLRQHYISQMTEQQHFQYTQQQLLQHQQEQLQQQQQQQQQNRQPLPHQHFHPRPQQQQLVSAYHSPTTLAPQPDAISLYSANSANVATMRQQQPPQHQQLQTPIAVQCDKYYLSPTHQSYTDGGFIKSSQNIKQYISPLASPSSPATVTASAAAHLHLSYEQQNQQMLLHQQQQHQQQSFPSHKPLQQLQPQQQQQHHIVVNSRNFDAISLSPSFASVMDPNSNLDVTSCNNNLRWRSQSNIQYNASSSTTCISGAGTMKTTHSTDMLATLHASPSPAAAAAFYAAHSSHGTLPAAVAAAIKGKPLDDISIASFSSETQKKQKAKQWLESSLDGPVIRPSANESPSHSSSSHTNSSNLSPNVPPSQPVRPPTSKSHAHNLQRDRPRLSSQSMSSGNRFNGAAQRGKASRLLQDDDGKYTKLSQSTSYLNSMDAISVTTYFPDSTAGAGVMCAAPSPLPPRDDTFKYLPPKISTTRPPVAAQTTPSGGPEKPSALSPDIRIESPKNMTVVQQATFQPYKEITKPFEMADFYKYSTKFRQKEAGAPTLNPEQDQEKPL